MGNGQSAGHGAGNAAQTELAARLRAGLGARRVQEHASLAPYTTWRVGGPADLLATAESVDQLVLAAGSAVALGVPWRVLGYGSNVLVRDGGIAGLVIVNRSRALGIDGTQVVVDGGMLLSTLARRTAAAGLAGLEWCAGIPGSVGGAVVSNAGAHGGQMSDTLQRVLLLHPTGTIAAWQDERGSLIPGGDALLYPHARDLDFPRPRSQNPAIQTTPIPGDRAAEQPLAEEQHGATVAAVWHEAAALDLAYRHSKLRRGTAPEEVVLRAEFALQPDEPAAMRARMDAQRRQRKATQPLNRPSAGSVFKNPPGNSAARLIDEAGLKGMHIGGAQVSTLHANFMVTDSTATASDLLALIAAVQERVRERYGVGLELEVQPIGR